MFSSQIFAALEWRDLEPILMLAILGAVGVAIGVPAIIVTQWRMLRQRQLSATLIQDMLAHGMTAAEIEQVLLVWSADPQQVAKIWRQRRKEEQKLLKNVRQKGIPAKPVGGF
jgi:hypothetical protein